MPFLAENLNLSTFQFGLLTSVMGLTRLIFNIPLASLGDVFGRRPLLISGPLLTSVAMVGTGFSNSLYELLGWRFMTGFSSSIQMTGAQLYLADISNTKNRARTLAPTTAAWAAGATIGPAIGGFLAELYGLRAPFYFVGAAIVCVSLNNYFMLTETKPPTPNVSAMTRISVIANFSVALKQWRELLKNKNISSVVLLHTTFWFTNCGAQLTLLPLIASQTFGMQAGAVGGLFALISIIGVILSQPAAYIADKIGRKYAILPGALIVSSAVAILPFITSVNGLIGLLAFWATGNAVLGTAPTAFLTDHTTSQTRSQGLALHRSGGDLGMVLGAGVMGFLASVVDLTTALTFNAAVLACATALFGWQTRDVIDPSSPSSTSSSSTSSPSTPSVSSSQSP
eukprot:TRINITY_DN4019_c0_g1_i2.p1 TRINITY_DN4019_c0_g1~~TRINITY_DN4019_c0_g1_i2.p1  ORF type:complete len:398 (-),score=65.24 TRINITY_DN4019_c0_g1_i2:29-1222(-)